MDGVKLIGITGGSGSGKSTVVKRIKQAHAESVFIAQDNYYKSAPFINNDNITAFNFDHPDAFDWHLLAKQIAQLKEGEAIEQPIYDYLTCTRQPETIHIEPREIIVIEGIMALSDKKLRQQMDLKIFVDADADDRLIRVVQRDIVERGRTVAAVMERYERVLKPMHEQFIEPCKRYADVIIPQGGHNNAAINMLVKFIKQQLADK